MINPVVFFNINNDNEMEEIWLPITEQAIPNILPIYSVSNFGRVYSHFINRIMRITIHTNGYCGIILSLQGGATRSIGIHRLVMMVFSYTPNYNLYDVNHIYGVKINNVIDNLEWCTHPDNLKHAYDTGLAKIGEDNSLSTHTNEQVHKVCKGLEDRLPLMQIAINAGLDDNETSMKFVSQIKSGDIWTHISKHYNIPKERNNQLFTDDQIRKICIGIEQGLSNAEVAYSVRPDLQESEYLTTIRNIRSKRRFTRISKNYKF